MNDELILNHSFLPSSNPIPGQFLLTDPLWTCCLSSSASAMVISPRGCNGLLTGVPASSFPHSPESTQQQERRLTHRKQTTPSQGESQHLRGPERRAFHHLASACVCNLVLPPLPQSLPRWPLAVCQGHRACVLVCTGRSLFRGPLLGCTLLEGPLLVLLAPPTT